MYCALCGRPVEARRQIGVGTVLLAVLTVGISLLAIPFYPKRCSICRSSAVSATNPDAAGKPGDVVARISELERRLSLTEGELESANIEMEKLMSERDFYRKLLDPAAREKPRDDDAELTR
jgi:hypothetical protein